MLEPLLSSVPSGASLLITVAFWASVCTLIALCACHQKSKSSRNHSAKKNGSVSAENPPDSKVTPNGNGNVATVSNADEEEVYKVQMRPVSMPATSSSSMTRALNKLHNRVKSQDHRALPEIPRVPMATDDEDDEDDLYDVISGNRRKHSTPTKSKKATIDSDNDSLYAGVKDSSKSETPYGGSDSTYAGIRDTSPSSSSVNLAAAAASIVADGADVTYAQIDEKRPRLSRRIDPPQLEVYSPPPVPSKNFESENESSSPSLPPRNQRNTAPASSNGAVVHSAIHLYEMPSDPEPSNVEGAVSFVASGPGAEEASTNVREPKYSKVTARESLDNLKRRQAHPLQLQQQQQSSSPPPPPLPPLMDADYASVDYDEIRSPGAAESSTATASVAPDRNSLSSDVYAEIASSSGRGSARSSTYARVQDCTQAPPPPPVEVLRQLSRPDGEDDIPDPGYSKIKCRSQPKSVPSETQPVSPPSPAPVAQTSGRRSPLYAIVNKGSKETEAAVRPKTGASAAQSDLSQPASVGADPGYQTIGSVEAFPFSVHRVQSQRQRQREQRDNTSDYDPNYEKVSDFDRPPVTATVTPTPAPMPQFPWQNQEHIYQEIKDPQQEVRRSKKESPKSTGL